MNSLYSTESAAAMDDPFQHANFGTAEAHQRYRDWRRFHVLSLVVLRYGFTYGVSGIQMQIGIHLIWLFCINLNRLCVLYYRKFAGTLTYLELKSRGKMKKLRLTWMRRAVATEMQPVAPRIRARVLQAGSSTVALGSDNINDVVGSGAEDGALETKRVEHLNQARTDLDIRTRSSDRSTGRGSDTENSVLTTGRGEPQATNCHVMAVLSSGGGLRRGWIRRACPITAKPPPLLAAVLPWNHSSEGIAARPGERERRLEEKGLKTNGERGDNGGAWKEKEGPLQPLVFNCNTKSDDCSGRRTTVADCGRRCTWSSSDDQDKDYSYGHQDVCNWLL
ncbi:hypothetical protein PIB30_054160 [Stylosanthes scabra]|uniref:Uncharacterized protein n=1 Tax=Stylosanthes scabra TaxID=79078 RepID=A0ABU6SIS8_9FABA|nr:hypothetical protein [Stylosanthes scabra]